jgi:hypothetical protein
LCNKYKVRGLVYSTSTEIRTKELSACDNTVGFTGGNCMQLGLDVFVVVWSSSSLGRMELQRDVGGHAR